jgi:surface protein
MFYGCTDLLYLDISNFTVEEGCKLSDGRDSGVFWDCASLLDLRLDNCYPDTIERIINSNGFRVNPNNVIEDLPRVIYVREENKHDLTLSTGSVFGYIKDPAYITNKDDETKSNYINDREVVNVIVNTQADFDRYEDNSLDSLFNNCGSLRLINGIEQWNTTGIEYMQYMFAGCTHLVSLNLSSFDISNAHNIYNMFDGCTNLRYLDISNFIMGEESHYYITNDMFRDCNNLRHLRLDNCDRYTIEKIINSGSFPTGDISGETRKMYVKEANIANEWGDDKLGAPDGWEFVYLVEAKKEEE